MCELTYSYEVCLHFLNFRIVFLMLWPYLMGTRIGKMDSLRKSDIGVHFYVRLEALLRLSFYFLPPECSWYRLVLLYP